MVVLLMVVVIVPEVEVVVIVVVIVVVVTQGTPNTPAPFSIPPRVTTAPATLGNAGAAPWGGHRRASVPRHHPSIPTPPPTTPYYRHCD